jgi:CRP/FNR family transcriptional regulator, cyclic AMP receptor protein
MNHTLDALRHLHLLDGIEDVHLQQLATIARSLDFPADTVIFREGQAATDIYLVVTGNVALDICAAGVGCRRILTVGEGELLGWSPLLEQERLTATARTLTATQAIALDSAQILLLCEQDPKFGYEFMKRAALAIAQRLSATRLQLLNVYGEQMPLSTAVEE